MIRTILGDTIDIHGGGKDLIFPHHENEIAQSECLNEADLAHFWIHNGLITVDGQKMSKSMNNFITMRDLLDKYDAETVRFLLLSNHYASPLEVNKDLLVTAEKHLYGFYANLDEYRKLAPNFMQTDLSDSALLKSFEDALDNDFNISLFLAELFGVFAEVNKSKGEVKKQKAAEVLAVLQKIAPVTGLFRQKEGQYVASIKKKYLPQIGLTEAEIATKIAARSAAKAEKNWAVADEIRGELSARGIALMDTPNGTEWGLNFAAMQQK